MNGNIRRLLFVILMLIAVTLTAGDNPFSGQVTVSDEADTAVTVSPPVKEGDKIKGVVDVPTYLNVRTEPWGDIIGALQPGDNVTITGQFGDWYKIDFNGKTAYVHSAYILQPGEAAKPFARDGWVNSPTGLNVRRVPNGDIIGTLRDQQGVQILGVAGGYYKIKWGENEAFVSKHSIDTDQPSAPGSSSVAEENFLGYVTADSGLNVRTAPWGTIDTSLPYGIAVQVTGKINDWYRINYNGKVRYVHASYITKNRSDVTGTTPTAQPGQTIPAGSLQQRIVAAARNLIGSKNFRGAEVDYGNKACAQVVSTALKNAGAMDRVVLNCRAIISDLRAKGWQEVSVPPFCEGDVITWKTYDYTGDGVDDPDTHVGIIVKEGNSFMSMSNSSRLRTPRLHDPYYMPVTRVMRKVA